MTDDSNALVDPYSHTGVKEYLPGGNQASPIPGITKGPGANDQNSHYASGIPILGAVENVYADIQAGDWFNGGFDALSGVLDYVGLAIGAAGLETIGGVVQFIAQPVIAWIIDHVAPVRYAMDELVGNPGAIAGVSRTWTNMGHTLGVLAQSYQSQAAGTSAYWQGEAGDTYRKQAQQFASVVNTAGVACECWAAIEQIVSDAVTTAHNLVRDILSSFIAALIGIAIDALDAPPPVDIIQAIKDGGILCAEVLDLFAKAMVKVLQGLAKAMSVVVKIITAVRELLNAIKYLVQLAQQKGNAAPAPA